MDLVDKVAAALQRTVLPVVIARGGALRVVAVEGWRGDPRGARVPRLGEVTGLQETLVALRAKTAHAERLAAAGVIDTPEPLT